ncbi:DUF3592 domain-containing protein [Alkalimonas sp. NCh-2]|uniref:DUF3592 domain-containing protein n=1 Tax=Alkalimonas sp. NCh-2 TaxID=3144846 RepID=UPI0031F6E55F
MKRILLFLMLAIPFWYAALSTAKSSVSFLTQGETASGVITSRVLESGCRSPSGKGCTIELTVAFETADGQRLQQRFSSQAAYYRDYQTGDPLPIRYNTSEPTQAMIINWQRILRDILFYGSAVISFSLILIRRLMPSAKKCSQATLDTRLLLLIPTYLFGLLALFILMTT